jgi:hypothetical protein
MPLKAIDVAIGMAFLYLLLTLVASAFVELVSTIRNWRGRMLADGLAKLLEDTTVDPKDFYGSPFIRALARDPAGPSALLLRRSDEEERRPSRRARRSWRKYPFLPSYIPPSAFSSALVSLLWQRCIESSPKLQRTNPDETARAIGALLEHLQEAGALQIVVETALATQGPSIQGVRLALERWYNDAMDRLTGDYKRLTQAWLVGIGVLGALAGDIDSVAVAKWLWTGDAARQAVVASATEFSKSHRLDAGAAKRVDQAQDADRKTVIDQQLSAVVSDVSDASEALTRLQFPLGWHLPLAVGPMWLLQYLIGCLISGIAISAGSSFWFDALQTLVKIRGTGPRPNSR